MVSICPEDHPEIRTRTCWQIFILATAYTFCIDHPTSYWFLEGLEGSFPIFLGNPGSMSLLEHQAGIWVLTGRPTAGCFPTFSWACSSLKGCSSELPRARVFPLSALGGGSHRRQAPFLVQSGLLRVSHRLNIDLPQPSWLRVTCCLFPSPSHPSFPLRQR